MKSKCSVAPENKNCSGRIYTVRLARSKQDLRDVQSLRLLVFNTEMRLGYAETYESHIAENAYDCTCDHLLIECAKEVVGTYRLRVLSSAHHLDESLCGQEFDLSKLKPLSTNILELGRACIVRAHRSLATFRLLWKGIVDYAATQECKYFLGCTSLMTQNQLAAYAFYSRLPRRFLASGRWKVLPKEVSACGKNSNEETQDVISRLLAFYIAMGAKVCGPPAIDRRFRTIDLLTYFDVHAASLRARQFLALMESN